MCILTPVHVHIYKYLSIYPSVSIFKLKMCIHIEVANSNALQYQLESMQYECITI